MIFRSWLFVAITSWTMLFFWLSYQSFLSAQSYSCFGHLPWVSKPNKLWSSKYVHIQSIFNAAKSWDQTCSGQILIGSIVEDESRNRRRGRTEQWGWIIISAKWQQSEYPAIDDVGGWWISERLPIVRRTIHCDEPIERRCLCAPGRRGLRRWQLTCFLLIWQLQWST